jgi:hypothetical protein
VVQTRLEDVQAAVGELRVNMADLRAEIGELRKAIADFKESAPVPNYRKGNPAS